MSKNAVSLPVIFTKMTPRVDRSWKLEFETRELIGKSIETLADRLGTEGYIVHSPNDDLSDTDIPAGQADSGMEGKSPSQRMRAVLYVLWGQNGKPGGSFDSFYQARMESLIEQVKSKLESAKES